MIREDNASNNSLFWGFQMGLSDGAFFMIKHTPLPYGNHPILSPICPMGVADMLGLSSMQKSKFLRMIILTFHEKIEKLAWIRLNFSYFSWKMRLFLFLMQDKAFWFLMKDATFWFSNLEWNFPFLI